MERITACQARSDYELWVKFTDGAEGEIDVSHLVGVGVFASWSDPAAFARVAVDPLTNTVCWPDGIDLDPDMIYSKITGKRLPGSDIAA